MGNVLLRGGINRRRPIKIMKADGSVMKLQSPVCVKEILIDYPNHGIFEVPAGPPFRIGSFTRPLPERTELAGVHPLSFPEAQLINYNSNSNSNSNRNRKPFAKVSSRSVPDASCRLQRLSRAGTATNSRKQEEEADPVVNKINRRGLRVVSSSYSANGSTVRTVKLRLRKEEVASFLSANNLLIQNVVVPTTIQRATRKSALSPWKPSLDTIAELQNPLSDS